tara:strand:- start:357 stop:527 length:171 start_codon:yes stop_codon:yes gene_type:complete
MVSSKQDKLEKFISKQIKAQRLQPKAKAEPKTAVEHLESWNGAKGGNIGGKGFLSG